MCGVGRAVLSVACHIRCPAVQFLVNTVQTSRCATPLSTTLKERLCISLSLSVTCFFSSFKVNRQGVCLSKIPILGCQSSCEMDCMCVCKFLSAVVNHVLFSGLLCTASMFGLSWRATLHVRVWLSDFVEALALLVLDFISLRASATYTLISVLSKLCCDRLLVAL